MNMPLAILQWNTALHPVLGTALLLALVAWIFWLYRATLRSKPSLRPSYARRSAGFAKAGARAGASGIFSRMDRFNAAALIAPKVLIVLLLSLALFDPVWRRETFEVTPGRILALLDISPSMAVKDDACESRLARARSALERIEKGLPSEVSVETLNFDTALRAPDGATNQPADAAYTDLGACLADLAGRPDISACLGIVLLTDGGDDPSQPTVLPPVPISIVGVGSDPAAWDDVAVAEIQFPPAVEENVNFEIGVDLVARAGGARDFARKLEQVDLVLEKESGGAWSKVDEQKVNLANRQARVAFRQTLNADGLHRYRVAVPRIEGELSTLNNAREFCVSVSKKSLRVLYFTREMGADFKLIRNELGRDPGLSFTALFRTVGERFTVQSDEPSADAELREGFSAEGDILQRFDCLIIGAFPPENWRPAEMLRLAKFVEEGGAIVFTGGDNIFGPLGYARTPLAPLFPWTIDRGRSELLTGHFAVALPPAAAAHPVMAGIDKLLAEERDAALDSVNDPGPLKAGAVGLLNVMAGGKTIPAIAVQAYGRGKALGIAGNTFWKWARKSNALKTAHGLFWRQAVRYLTAAGEVGRSLDVRWNKEQYLPGEQALAEIRVGGVLSNRTCRFAATLSAPEGTAVLNVEPAHGQANTFNVKMTFKRRGEYVFRLTAQDGGGILETVEKALTVAPLKAEGTRLELDEPRLQKLAERAGGIYVRADDPEALVRHLAGRVAGKPRIVETAPFQSRPYFAALIIALLVIEWILRRRRNLI